MGMCPLRWVLAPSALLADLYATWVLGPRNLHEYAFFTDDGLRPQTRDLMDWEDGVEVSIAND